MRITTIEVETGRITVNGKYYTFPFKLWVNAKLKAEGTYESDHAWENNKKGLIRMLNEGEAAKLVIEQEL